MNQVRVNLTLDEDVWKKFVGLVPKREKSKIITGLLKSEIAEIEHRREQELLAAAFCDASKDPERQAAVRDWELLDSEGWEE
jgi:hypothetical protein